MASFPGGFGSVNSFGLKTQQSEEGNQCTNIFYQIYHPENQNFSPGETLDADRVKPSDETLIFRLSNHGTLLWASTPGTPGSTDDEDFAGRIASEEARTDKDSTVTLGEASKK